MAVDFILVSCEQGEESGGDELLTAADLACATALHPDLIQRLYGIGVFDSVREEDGEPRFSANTIFRIRRAIRLRHDLGLSWLSLGLVADLLERVEILEARIRTLETFQAQDAVLDSAA